MSLKLNSSGGGSVTLQEPVTASTLTLTLPAFSGTAATLASVTNNGVLFVNSSGQPTSGSALTFDGVGGLGIAGATPRLLSNMSGTLSTRFIIQNSTTNGNSRIYLYPNGTGNISAINGANNSDVAATDYQAFDLAVIGTTDVRLSSQAAGAAAFLPLTFYTNNAEQMRLTSTGLGIGTSSPSQKLSLQGSSTTYALAETTGTGTSSGFRMKAGGSADYTLFTTQGVNQFAIYDNVAGAERLTLSSSGNLGLGVTPSAWSGATSAFQNPSGAIYSFSAGSQNGLNSNAFYNGSSWVYSSTSAASDYYQQGGSHIWRNAPSGTAGNAISFTQAMTLDASGNLLVGTTNSAAFSTATGAQTTASGRFLATCSGDTAFAGSRLGSDGNIASWYRSTTFVGSISVTGSATAYNTSSDYRLKNITGPITTSGAYIDSLNPVEGTWKADGSVFVGLIAHEAQEVSRTQVATGTKDGKEMQGMTYSSPEMIANLIAEIQSLRARVAAIQEQQVMIAQLQADIASLKGTA